MDECESYALYLRVCLLPELRPDGAAQNAFALPIPSHNTFGGRGLGELYDDVFHYDDDLGLVSEDESSVGTNDVLGLEDEAIASAFLNMSDEDLDGGATHGAHATAVDVTPLSPCLRRAIALATVASERAAFEQVALLLPVLQSSSHQSSSECLQRCLLALANAVVVDATSARVATRHDYTASGHLLFHSRRRTDALVLFGLLHLDRPEDAQAKAGVMALLPKLVSNMLDQRRNGHWWAHATN
jgi:hypothetical protein